MRRRGCYGPPQRWQSPRGYWYCSVSPLRRLELSGSFGLPVGPGTRQFGGLRVDTAKRFEGKRLAILVRDASGKIVSAYPCQLSFDF
jgi:hypothetical protein